MPLSCTVAYIIYVISFNKGREIEVRPMDLVNITFLEWNLGYLVFVPQSNCHICLEQTFSIWP